MADHVNYNFGIFIPEIGHFCTIFVILWWFGGYYQTLQNNI
jgi:hypothetical protein